MCSKPRKSLIKNVNFRLASLFSLLFIGSFFLVFGVTYFLLASSLIRGDHEELRVQLLSLGADYEIGGFQKLLREIELAKIFGERSISMVRVADWRNATLYLLAPAYWTAADVENLTFETERAGEELFRLQTSGNRDVLEVATLGLYDGNLLQVGMSVRNRVKTLQRFIGIMIPAAALVLFGSFLGGVLFSTRMLQPIRQLTSAVQAIVDTGKIKARIPPRHTGDELDRLVNLFNAMLEKIEQLVTGMLGALDTVAHDLRTPVTRFRGIAERALQSLQDGETCGEALESCMEESERILTMLNSFMDISEAESGVLKLNRERVNIGQVVEDVVDLYRYTAEERNIAVSVETGAPRGAKSSPGGQAGTLPGIVASVDLQRMRQVVANLLDNALKYTSPGGSVSVVSCRKGDRVCISVEDSGIGIPEDEIRHVWDRLYRGRESRSVPGLGLGLSLVRAIVQAHGGSVGLESTPGRGSKFTVSIPVD